MACLPTRPLPASTLGWLRVQGVGFRTASQWLTLGVAGSQQKGQQVALQPRHQALAFRVPEAHVVLQQLGLQ